jgi:hypothetical protein
MAKLVCPIQELKIVLTKIMVNCKSILSYFDNRSSTTSAESFNAKITAF